MDAVDDIRNWSREEDYVLYLARRRKGDPIPQGASPENPFTADPSDFYDDSWYHFDESPNEKNWEGDVRKTGAGLWKWCGTVTIPTESVLGFRNAFDFYQGNTFVGTRTGWRMHQYSAGPNKEGSSQVQEDVTLCRLFWSNEERVSSSALNNSPVEGAGLCTLGSDVIASKERREVSSRRESDGTLLGNVSQDGFIELKDITSSDGEIRELDDHFSERDYMEFDDILTSDTASTSSDNSSNISVSSNEYLNIDELLGEITRNGSVPVDDEECDHLSGFTGPVQLDQDDRDNTLNGMASEIENNSPCHDFSTDGYLELKDLLPSNMASTVSGNLGCFGQNPGEHFDIDELLRDTAINAIAPVEEQRDNSDHLVCIENSICSSPVSLTGAASVTSCAGNNTEAADEEQPRDQPDHVPDVGPSASSCSRAGQVKRNLSDRSEGVKSSGSSDDSSSSGDDSNLSGSTGSGHDGYKKKGSSKTPQSKRRRSVKRLANIANIGKKFFCFK